MGNSTPPSAAGKPKILLYILDMGGYGGIEMYVLRLSLLLQQKGIYHPVVACTEGEELYRRLQEAGIEVHGIPSWKKFLPPGLYRQTQRLLFRPIDVLTWNALERIVRTVRPDIIQANFGRFETLYFKLWGYPTIYVFHGYGLPMDPYREANRYKRALNVAFIPLFRQMARHLDAMVFVSRTEQARFVRQGFVRAEDAGRVIHNGLPIGPLQAKIDATDVAAKRAELGLDPDKPIVLFLGRLDADNNAITFLELAKRLVEAPGAMQLVVAGSGVHEAAFRDAFNRPPLKGHGTVLGFREDVAELLACCDCTVSVSLIEAFGLRIVEAMAAGKPCLAYAIGALPELYEDPVLQAHFLAPAGDLDALALRIRTFLAFDAQAKQATAATLRQRAHAFDLEPFVNHYQQLYAEVLAKHALV